MLISFPFKKQASEYFTWGIYVSWIVLAIQLLVVMCLQNTNEITIVSSYSFCQSPIISSNIMLPFIGLTCIIYVSLMLSFCACFLWAIQLISRRDKTLTTVSKSKEVLKGKMIKKSVLVCQ